jgi:hypothetical protein
MEFDRGGIGVYTWSLERKNNTLDYVTKGTYYINNLQGFVELPTLRGTVYMSMNNAPRTVHVYYI